MARQPVHTEAAGKLTPRERVWAAIRALRDFTLSDLELRSKVNEDTVRSYLECLVAGGYVKCVEQGGTRKGSEYVPSRYTLLRDCGIHAPRLQPNGQPVTQGTANLNMWRTMRMIGEFDYRDLAHAASTDETPIAPATAKNYVLYLARAGYLQPVQKAKPKVPGRFRLPPHKYTGPKPPQIQRIKRVWDPNLGKVMYDPNPEEVADEQG
jgi:predicted AAA+ superfamily ATPase